MPYLHRAIALLCPLSISMTLILVVSGCGSGPSSHLPNLEGAMTTLQAEVGNNTSAPNGFSTQGNGNAA